jgi:hypothetical protein
MTNDQKQQIREDAERAARSGKTPNEACNHPFSSEQGRYWVECYWLVGCEIFPMDAMPRLDDGWEGSERRAG